MTLRQKQSKFARMFSLLILFAFEQGYEVTLGHTWRPRDPRCHGFKLAGDLNLFKNGRYLRSTKSHKPLGEFWESLGGSWGGRFGDGNHYSLEHNGKT